MIEQIKTHILYWLKKQNMQDIALLIEQGVQSEEVLNSFEKSVLKSIPEYKEFTLKTKFDLNLSEHQLFQDVLLQRALGTNPEKQLIYHFLNAMVNEPKTTPNGCNGGKDKLVIKKSQANNEELSSKNCYSFMDCFKKRQSFIDQHFTSFAFNLPCNNEEFILFEDFTDNHNKATVGAFSFNNLPCVATLVVETRNGRRIERELRPAQNAILFDTTLFVEDLRRVIIRCSGDPTGSCSGFISVAKTFCISCSNKFSKVLRSEFCFTDLHTDFVSYSIPCNSPKVTIFENLTSNHNKADVVIQNFSSDCTLTLRIKTKKETIVESFAGFANRAFQVKDLISISLQCTGEVEGLCSGNIFIQNSFCICCDK